MMFFKFTQLFILMCLFMFSGCSTYVIPDVDLRSEPYPTSYEISESEIIISKPHKAIKNVPFIVLVNQSYSRQETDEFLKLSLLKMGFNKFKTENEFMQLVYSHGLHKGVVDIYSHESLHRIYKKAGSFLLMVANYGGAGQGRVYFKVYDPESNEVLFEMKSSAFVYSYDQQVLYPSINALNNWYKSSLAK